MGVSAAVFERGLINDGSKANSGAAGTARLELAGATCGFSHRPLCCVGRDGKTSVEAEWVDLEATCLSRDKDDDGVERGDGAVVSDDRVAVAFVVVDMEVEDIRVVVRVAAVGMGCGDE